MVETKHINHLLGFEDIEAIKNHVKLLGVFKNLTDLLSGENYPTASLIKKSIDYIQRNLGISENDTETIKETKTLMQDKFDTRSYQSDQCQDIIKIACYLDPRFLEPLSESTKDVLIIKKGD